jgi:DNA-binding PadR family transcriptional regulator
MGSEGIYRKTEKGRTEIATRANRLGMRERTMLIMVDDKTSRRGLLAKNAHPTSEGILNSLLADGYIEIVPGAEPAAATAVPEASAAAAPAAPAAPPVEVSLVSASRFACRALVTYLGPSADDLTGLVEKAKGVEELTSRLEKCRQAVQSIAGKKKADEFWAGVSARLPPA